MTLDRCPLSIFCSRGTPPSLNPCISGAGLAASRWRSGRRAAGTGDAWKARSARLDTQSHDSRVRGSRRGEVVATTDGEAHDLRVQGYLAHKRQPPPRTYRGTSIIRKRTPLGPYSRTMPRLLWRSWGGGWFLMSEVFLYMTP